MLAETFRWPWLAPKWDTCGHDRSQPKKNYDRMFALYRVTTWLLVIFQTFYTTWNLLMASNGTQMGHSRSEQVPTNFFYMSEG